MNIDQIFERFVEGGKEFGKISHVLGRVDWDWPGTTIMPPTYLSNDKAVKQHHFERRMVDGDRQQIVVVDSIQSCANRTETALIKAKRRGLIDMPSIEFISESMGTSSSFELSHRIFSYEIRCALTEKGGNQRFSDTKEGKIIFGRNPSLYMEEIAKHCASSVLFGTWNSRNNVPGPSVNMARISRSFHNEIIAGVGEETCRSQSMIHRFNFETAVGVWHKETDLRDRVHEEPKAKKGWIKAKPADLGAASIPPTLIKHGVSPTWIREDVWIDFNCLRKFDTNDPQKDQQYRTMAALLGLLGHRMKCHDAHLRSGCTLIPKNEEVVTYQFLPSKEEFAVTVDDAIELYKKSLDAMDWYDASKTTNVYADEAFESQVEKHNEKVFT